MSSLNPTIALHQYNQSIALLEQSFNALERTALEGGQGSAALIARQMQEVHAIYRRASEHLEIASNSLAQAHSLPLRKRISLEQLLQDHSQAVNRRYMQIIGLMEQRAHRMTRTPTAPQGQVLSPRAAKKQEQVQLLRSLHTAIESGESLQGIFEIFQRLDRRIQKHIYEQLCQYELPAQSDRDVVDRGIDYFLELPERLVIGGSNCILMKLIGNIDLLLADERIQHYFAAAAQLEESAARYVQSYTNAITEGSLCEQALHSLGSQYSSIQSQLEQHNQAYHLALEAFRTHPDSSLQRRFNQRVEKMHDSVQSVVQILSSINAQVPEFAFYIELSSNVKQAALEFEQAFILATRDGRLSTEDRSALFIQYQALEAQLLQLNDAFESASGALLNTDYFFLNVLLSKLHIEIYQLNQRITSLLAEFRQMERPPASDQ